MVTYDPFVQTRDVHNLEEALLGAKAVILATDHAEFKSITPEVLKDKGVEILIDGKNFFDKDKFIEAGILYQGIGR